jgi:hypothetical protein
MKRLPFKKDSVIEFSESYVIDLENGFKLKMPGVLIEFLKIQNGGTLEDVYFLDRYYVNQFFPVWDNRYGTISQVLSFIISENIEEMIPFAGDDDSMTYCIGIGENNFGKVFSYQSCDWTPGENPLVKICDSFKVFIYSFKQEI